WDGWEPWDTLHRTPGKLEWSIWAFTHARAELDGTGYLTEGSYISWMNDWDLELLSSADVDFLASIIDAAEADAEQLVDVLGPVMVIDHDAVAAALRPDPRVNASVWIEDASAL